MGPLSSLAVSADGFHAATCAATEGDRSIKIFDVVNFDMIHMLPDVGFQPLALHFIHRKQQRPVLVVSERTSGKLHFYHIDGATPMEADDGELVGAGASAAPQWTDPNAAFFVKETHGKHPVHLIRFNEPFGLVVSADVSGNIEYWQADAPFDFDGCSAGGSSTAGQVRVGWQYKLDTDLYSLMAAKVTPLTIDFSPNGRLMAVTNTDRILRVFKTWSGKLWKKFDDETLEKLNATQATATANPPEGESKTPAQEEYARMYRLDAIDFGRRMAIEREMEKNTSRQLGWMRAAAANTGEATGATGSAANHHSNIPIPPSNCVFDESGCYLMYPSMLGIKVLNLYTSTIVRILGKVENTERFVNLLLFQAIPSEVGESQQQQMGAARVKSSGNALEGLIKLEDPTLFTLAYRKERFYWFSSREPEADSASTSRDVWNEKPTTSTLLTQAGGVSGGANAAATKLGLAASASLTLHTSMGDITVQLFPEEAPKTCENFVTHAKDGYYNGVTFHRVIKESVEPMRAR